MKTIAILFQCLLAAAMILVVSGCGGSATGQSVTPAAVGAASVTIKWPTTTTRLIPDASNSITVSFKNGTTVVSHQTVARPTSGGTQTVVFNSLPAGSLTLVAQAFPSSNGTGVAQASASQPITIVQGQDTPASLVMASTIQGFHVAPATLTVAVGSNLTVVQTAYDGSGATVLTTASHISWASSDTTVATVTNAGVVTGVNTGTSTLTVTDSESGVTGSFTLSVTPTTGGVNVTVH